MINNNKAFTLMETLIVVLILGILSVVLIRAYITISQIGLRIQQESTVTQEILTVSEILQNIAEKNTIDYDRYASEYRTGYLSDHKGFADKLYLTGQDGNIRISTQGSGCLLNPGDEFTLSGDTKEIQTNCRLAMEKNGETIQLTNPKKTYLSKAVFRIIPFASQDQFINDDDQFSTMCQFSKQTSNYLACLHKPGFWLIMKAYTSNYSKDRATNISFTVQQFFNL